MIRLGTMIGARGDEKVVTNDAARSAMRPRRWLTGCLAALIASATLAGTAHAQFGVTRFDGEVVNRDSAGNVVAATQAGSHPDEVSASIAFTQYVDPVDGPLPVEDVKDIRVDLPAGFTGNPLATPRCSEEALESRRQGTDCPPDSQVGVVSLITTLMLPQRLPVFNMEPPDDVPGVFAFNIGGLVPVHMRATVRSESDYGLAIEIPDISQAVPVLSTSLTFWGVPGDPSHDADRGTVVDGVGNVVVCSDSPDPACRNASGQARRPFLTNPTKCDGPVQTTLNMTSWRGSSAQASFMTHLPAPQQDVLVGPDGCDRVPFDAAMKTRPTSSRAGVPSGYSFDLSIPQDESPDGLAQAHLKRASVTLPEGVSISPTAAAGLTSCSDAQSGIGTLNDPTCPAASKVGTVTIDTPLLERPMQGAVYIADPKPGNLFRLVLTASGPGVKIKLPGNVRPNPRTGQLVATFDNNPQLPFSNLHLEFKDGPRAALSNPPKCGTYKTSTVLTAWSGKSVTSNSSFDITRDGNGAPCPPRAFTPSFIAGVVNPVGGSSSTFSVTFGRDDEDPTLRDVTVDLPEGLTGRIANADLCKEPQASAGTCGEGSRIGSTTTGAGGGTNPFFLPGRVYVTGPYNGAPFGMSIVVPAIAGPFDLGTVVVRAAIYIDRRTAALRVVSDPLPTILEGVPLLIRQVSIKVDKPGFMLAPTSCRPQSVNARIGSNENSAAAVSSRFQVGGCNALPFRPKLAIRIGARGRTAAESTTALQATLTMPRGAQANNKSVAVTLPANVNSRLAALRGACSVEAARARTCGRDAVIGSAVALTPLLRDPLVGPVYIVRTRGNRLPDLWVALRGQLEFDLIGRVKIVGSKLQLRTTFGEIPDVPVSMFRLNFIAGRNAALGLVRNICSKSVRRGMIAGLTMRGQNGRVMSGNPRMQVAGCARSSPASRSRSTRRR